MQYILVEGPCQKVRSVSKKPLTLAGWLGRLSLSLMALHGRWYYEICASCFDCDGFPQSPALKFISLNFTGRKTNDSLYDTEHMRIA